MQVSLVPTEFVEKVWPDIESYMDGAAQYTFGRYTKEDIKASLLNEPQQLWIAFDDGVIYGAVVTEVCSYPQIQALVMHFTGGVELTKWKDPMLAILQRFAKDSECSIIESYGRAGWERVFKGDGFKMRFMFYELPVEK